MTRLKHVLVLIILVLPMFAFAPSLIARPNEVLSNPTQVDMALPAQFVQENLRVAVYAEDNTSLPAYATGGMFTDHYADVISLMQSAGYVVTALTTQDILDHKLMVADFDAFVLPNQLPREEIVNLVKDYWLGGGGILSLDGSIGYCFYTGMIDPSLEGSFELSPPADPGYWAITNMIDTILINQSHPITKAFEIYEEFTMPAGYFTILNGLDLPSIVGDRMIPLLNWDIFSQIITVAAFDNPDRGGRIVQVPTYGNSTPVWLETIMIDAIDWLAPRPKAHIAIDYTHVPFYGVDSWDENVSHVPRYEAFRNFAVNHSFTFDKLYPTGGELTAADIAPFDVIIMNPPSINYTANEMAVIQAWVENGGGLFMMADWINQPGVENVNELMSDWGLRVAIESATLGTTLSDSEANHPIFEGMNHLSFNGGKFLNITGDAYALANVSSDIALAGAEPGEGRVILAGDINFIQDVSIVEEDNIQFSINLFNWLSSGPAKVLVYADSSGVLIHPNVVPLNGPVAQALNDLGISFYMTSDKDYFNMSLFAEDWDMVIFDNTNYNTRDYQPHLIDFVADGGKLIFSTWNIDATTGVYFGVQANNSIGIAPPTVYLWEPDHPIFNLPADYGETNLNSSLDLLFGTYAINFTTYANATPLAGYTAAHAGAAIVIGAGGNAIVNGPLLTVYNEDTDDSTYVDSVELWENQIAFLYYDRPSINQPDDVTYMETETENEISWTPIADAGPWEYVVRENGSIIDVGSWDGGTITINVDGVSTSITEYELTVFDKLGYSVSDLVVLNVTEYIGSTTTTTNTTATGTGGEPLDSTLLIIIGAVGAAVVIIIIIIMLRGKKK